MLSAGTDIKHDGKKYRAFAPGSNSTLFVDIMSNYTTIFPCFELTPGSVVSGLSSFPGTVQELTGNLSCSLAWITSGRSVRDNCLTALGDRATPFQAYLAGLYHMDTVPDLYQFEYGCTTLLSWPEDDMDKVHMEKSRSLNTFLSSDQAYGSFFPTSSLKNWVEDSVHFSSQFQMSNALDLETRKFFVYLITRNLNENGLFYARIRVTFTFAVEGTATVTLDTTYSPMIDFSYGTRGHSWIFQDVLIWESVLLFLFAFFTIREFLQLVEYTKQKKKLTAVQPVPERGNSSSEIAHEGALSYVSPPTPVPVLQIESDKNLGPEADDGGGHNLERSEHGDKNKPDDYRSVSSSGFIDNIDLNNNGKDDLEELEQLAAEGVPDKSVIGNVLDWITVGIVSGLLGLRYDYISTARRLHELILDLSEQHNYSDRMTLIVSSFDSISSLVATQRLLLMLVMFVGMTQFFRYLSFDSRLGIVAETVLHSIEDLLPVLFIFVFILMGYSVLGASIFGQDVESWSTVGSSMLNLMIFIVGEYGTYFEIYEKQPVITAIYFWSYMVVAYFIIFNMILAIIFNVYNKKTEALLEKNSSVRSLTGERSSEESRKER